MKVNCQDYRLTMQLLALKKKLNKAVTDPAEQDKLRKEIKKLEEMLDLD